MSLTIRPDPSRPAGGHAILSFDAKPGIDREVLVAVFDSYASHWLAPSAQDADGRVRIGDANWHTARHDFGPYPVSPVGGRLEIVIGPEIVNKLDGYATLRFVAGALDDQAVWPDDVMPREGAPLSASGLQVARKAPSEPSQVSTLRKAVAPETAPPAATAPVQAEPQRTAPPVDIVDTEPDTTTGGPKRMLLIGLAALLVLIAALGGWFATRGTTADQDAVSPTEPVAAAPDDPCSGTALRAMMGEFGSLRAQLDRCGSAVSADTLLPILEDAVKAGTPEALVLFGKLYDSAAPERTVKEVMGLNFGDIPAQAAEYYSRAKAAGSTEAGTLLSAACARLAEANDTLSAGARDDFCR